MTTHWTRRITVRSHDHESAAGRILTVLEAHLKLEKAWRSIGWIVATVSAWQGFVAVAGNAPALANRWARDTAPLPGGYLVHGWITLGFAGLLAWELRGGNYSHRTVWLLRAFRFYTLLVALAWLAAGITRGLALSEPAWWALVAGLLIWLAAWAPPVTPRQTATERRREYHGA